MANDITIIGTILGYFIILAVILPFVTDAFGVTTTENNVDGLTVGVSEDDFGATNAFGFMQSLFAVFFWGFGTLPLAINIFHLILKIILLLVIARNVWIGGGG